MSLLEPRRGAGHSIVARHPKVFLGIAAVVGLLVSVLLRDADQDRQVVAPSPVLDAILNDPESPRVGPPDATVTVVVFTDYLCPVCRTTDPALERLVQRDGGVRVVFKDWPILGPGSVLSARVALAAHRQGRYLAMHRALMSTRLPLTLANMPAIAREAGVDWDRLAADLARDGPAIDAQLARQSRQAWSLGLQGTPDYLIGPYLVQGGLGERGLADAVADARRRR
ncbi:MAG TPA: DsbA family protein [Phenylobacterium sp.]|nr:DsbA family protein [Phenylobacterium sp.]